MARITYGFKMIPHRYYIPIMIVVLCTLFALVYIFGPADPLVTHTLYTGLLLSVFRLFTAYSISLVAALFLSLLIGQSKLGDALLPVFDLLQNIPSFALIPLFIFFFGYTNLMVIIFAASSILWPILFYVLHALRTARSDWSDAATIFGAVGVKRDLHYFLPLAFSAVVTGSIVGFSIGWEAVIGVEIIGLSSGIGVFLNQTLSGDRTGFALGIFLLLLVVFVLNRLVWMPLLRESQLYAE